MVRRVSRSGATPSGVDRSAGKIVGKASSATVGHAAGKVVAGPAPMAVGALIGDLMSHIHRRSAGDTLAIMNEVGLTMAQLVTLHVLGHEGTQSVSAIAGCLRLSPAATSHLVNRLVGVRLVGRVEDPSDRRQKRVSITAGGRRLIDRVQRERAREFAEVVARLSAEVRNQFARVLSQVIQELSSLPQDMS